MIKHVEKMFGHTKTCLISLTKNKKLLLWNIEAKITWSIIKIINFLGHKIMCVLPNKLRKKEQKFKKLQNIFGFLFPNLLAERDVDLRFGQ